MAKNLWELEHTVNDATDLLKQALGMTSTHLTDEHTGETLPWQEMGQCQERLIKALEMLETALDPVKQAIESERQYLDHLSDLADGASY